MAEDERDDDADLSDEELEGDGDAADNKSKSRQTQVHLTKKRCFHSMQLKFILL